MYAITIADDKRLAWDAVPDPVLKADEVLIRVHCAALNRADLMQRAGDYPPPPGAPDIMGLEVSGQIEALGEEAADRYPWHVGDRVCALLGGGGYAEYAAVKWSHCMPVPAGLSMEEAAALPEAYATAYLNLIYEGNARPGETLLFTAGGSGLGSAAIPLAKALGLRVITTVTSAKKAQAIADLGADRIVVTSAESLPDALAEEFRAGRGVDVAIDCVGGEAVGQCLPFVNRGARWIMIAALAGNLTQVDLKNLYVKGIRLIGSTLRSRPDAFKSQLLAGLVQTVWPLIEQGQLRPRLYRTLPIQQAEEAQAILQRSENVGKVVLRVL